MLCETIREVMDNDLRQDGQSGFPYYRKNSEVLDDNSEEVFHTSLHRLLSFFDSDDEFRVKLQDTGTLLEYWDPYSPFIKGEVNPARKRGMPRSILAQALVNQIVERVLLRHWSKAIHREELDGDIKKGIGFNERLSELILKDVNTLRENTSWSGTNVVKSDVAGWESSQSNDMMLTAVFSHVGEISLTFKQALLTYVFCLNRGAWHVDGQIVQKRVAGDIPTGCFMTSDFNAIDRLLCAQQCGSVWAICSGDDIVEGTPLTNAEYEARYNEIGIQLREVERIDPGNPEISFCSHTFTKDNLGCYAVLESVQKAICAFLFKEPTDERIFGLIQELKSGSEETHDLLRRAFNLHLEA